MKVYLANSGAYSDFRVHAAFTNEVLAAIAGENDPIELEVLDELPGRIFMRTMSVTYRLMHRPGSDHFHTPDRDPVDCPDTNILTEWNKYDEIATIWPWTHSSVTAHPVIDKWVRDLRTISTPRAEISVRVEGTDHERVARVFWDEAAKAKAQLTGVADA